MSTVAHTLAAAPSHAARRDLEVLLGHLLNVNRAFLIAHGETRVPEAFEGLRTRLSRGEPVAYLTGSREFFSRDFCVTPDVLIPRPETELLVELALERVTPGGRVLDLGTGSGAIAISIGCERACRVITATDHSPAALAVARENARRHACDVTFLEGSWLDPVSGRWDVIVSNPPYVAEHDPHLAALRCEPRDALLAGADGLAAIRTIVRDAPPHMRDGAWLMLEHGHEHADAVAGLLEGAGLADVETYTDLAGLPRVTVGRRVRP